MFIGFLIFFFFFLAEDGIRDGHVTGVQTCALPIYVGQHAVGDAAEVMIAQLLSSRRLRSYQRAPAYFEIQIGRASCRERWLVYVVAVKSKKNKQRTKLMKKARCYVIL